MNGLRTIRHRHSRYTHLLCCMFPESIPKPPFHGDAGARPAAPTRTLAERFRGAAA